MESCPGYKHLQREPRANLKTPWKQPDECLEAGDMIDKRALCRGCRDDFYNGNNELGVQECWLFKDAKVVQRYRIGWWTQQDRAENFQKVTTLYCHHAPGRYAQMERLPEHLR